MGWKNLEPKDLKDYPELKICGHSLEEVMQILVALDYEKKYDILFTWRNIGLLFEKEKENMLERLSTDDTKL